MSTHNNPSTPNGLRVEMLTQELSERTTEEHMMIRDQDDSSDQLDGKKNLAHQIHSLFEPTADYPINNQFTEYQYPPLPPTPCDLETYTLTKLSAEGGTARIYKAFESHSKESIAVKLLRRRFHQDPLIAPLFVRHGVALQQINIPHFANVIDTGESEWGPWWALEWVDGRTLREEIDQGTHWSSERLLNLVNQLCDALEGLHKLGITHGDLTPSNIMYSPHVHKSDQEHLTLIDVALPIVHSSDDLNSMTQNEGQPPPLKIFGQPQYIAPECFSGQRPDQRSDLYSLGVILFEITTGTLPFGSAFPDVIFEVLNKNAPVASVRQHPWPYPPSLDALISNLLSKSPDERCDSISEVRAELQQMSAQLHKRLELSMTEEVNRAELDLSEYDMEDTLSDSIGYAKNVTASQFNLSTNDYSPPKFEQLDSISEAQKHSSSSRLDPYTPQRSGHSSARRWSEPSADSSKMIESAWFMNLIWMLIGMLLTFLIRHLFF